jgi:hypothetical protein
VADPDTGGAQVLNLPIVEMDAMGQPYIINL